MIPYRLYKLRTDEHFVGVHEFEAASDHDAIEIAQRHASGCACELWSFDRFVRKLRPAQAEAAHPEPSSAMAFTRSSIFRRS